MIEKVDLTAFYPHTPERVWEALTNGKALARWLMPTDFKPVIGFRFRFEGKDARGRGFVEGSVLEMERLKRLVYSWEDGEEGTAGVIAWTLNPTDGGTQVRLEHISPVDAKPYVVIEAQMNWGFAFHSSLPMLLQILKREARRTPVPVVYVEENPLEEKEITRRAGFRQVEVTCS